MAPLSSTKLLWLLTILQQTLALSAHSPRDLEAFPAYNVVLSDRAVLNETALDLLAKGATAEEPAKVPRRHLMRTPSGQAFLCTVPVVTEERKTVDAQAEKDALVQAAERDRGLANGLALLEPMRNGCLYLRQGWFTYSFCYGSEIRQFHEVRVAGAIGPSEDPESEAYSLGLMPEATSVVKAPKYGSGSAAVLRQERIPARLGGGGEANQGLGWDEGGRYLSQTWSSGTVCDKTGLPREVEVQFHCNTQSIDRIAWIRETSICRYVMLIHTPRLCAERLFLEGRTDTVAPAAPIECQPVVRQLPKEIAGEEEGATSSVQKAATTEEDGVVRTEPDTPEEPAPLVAPGEEEMVQPEELDEHLNDDDDQEEHFFDDESYEEQETMLTLVYDPETGEIESAVTDSGEDVFLDSALRRMLFGDEDDADGTAEAESVQPQSGEEAQVHMEAEGGIPDLRQLIHDSISDALRTYAAQGQAQGQGGAAAAAAVPTDEAGAAPAQQQAPPPLLHQPLDEVVQSLLAAVRSPQEEEQEEEEEEDQTEAQPGTEKKKKQQKQRPTQQPRRDQGSAPKQKQQKMMQPGLHRYLQQFERERKTVQVPQKAVLGSDEHERLKRRFARRYDEAQQHDEGAESDSGGAEGREEEQMQREGDERVRDEL
ncbi:hypothetical protein JCM8115_004071 [Rhodotorula mucilaginosa]